MLNNVHVYAHIYDYICRYMHIDIYVRVCIQVCKNQSIVVLQRTGIVPCKVCLEVCAHVYIPAEAFVRSCSFMWT